MLNFFLCSMAILLILLALFGVVTLGVYVVKFNLEMIEDVLEHYHSIKDEIDDRKARKKKEKNRNDC